MKKLIAGLAFALVATAAIATGSVVPVLVGGEADYDACGSQGQVYNLNPKGDNFLAVREGPGTSYDKIDELHEGDIVNLCDYQDGWHGIVYGTDCGVGGPIAERNPYDGPCKTGWIFENYVFVAAG